MSKQISSQGNRLQREGLKMLAFSDKPTKTIFQYGSSIWRLILKAFLQCDSPETHYSLASFSNSSA